MIGHFQTSGACRTSSNMITAVHVLLDNIHVHVPFGNMVYCQKVAIQMATSCATLIANLFLYCYESQFKAIQKDSSEPNLVGQFNNIFKYLNSVIALSIPAFQKIAKEIQKNLLYTNFKPVIVILSF